MEQQLITGPLDLLSPRFSSTNGVSSWTRCYPRDCRWPLHPRSLSHRAAADSLDACGRRCRWGSPGRSPRRRGALRRVPALRLPPPLPMRHQTGLCRAEQGATGRASAAPLTGVTMATRGWGAAVASAGIVLCSASRK